MNSPPRFDTPFFLSVALCVYGLGQPFLRQNSDKLTVSPPDVGDMARAIVNGFAPDSRYAGGQIFACGDYNAIVTRGNGIY
jgi:hypothetical protein